MPIYKKGKRDLKDNYRPVSILPVLSKLYERSMFKQISEFFENIFSKNQCGFRKGHSTQQCLLAMLEKWKRSVDSGKAFGALLTDLSKAFDCLDHELLIAKLNAYGFSLPALRLIHDYLSHRKQRTRVNNSYSEWLAVMFGVPQGSNLGPLLFNIFSADLFLIHRDIHIANFADDNTPYLSAKNVEDVIESIERASVSLFRWFENNLLKGNADKCHFLVSTSQEVSLNVNNFKIKNSDYEKRLGVKFDSKLRFDQRITDLCRTASRKIHALARVTPFMNLSKRRLLMNSFFKTQFNYCPLIWMCHSRENNRKINWPRERCLRTIYDDKQSSFNELLEKDGSVSIHERNLQVLATEMYKIGNGLSTPLMKDKFPVNRNPYNLRQNFQFSRPRVNTV